MSRTAVGVIGLTLAAFVSAPGLAAAETFDGAYRGMIVCEKLNTSQFMLRAPFDIMITGKTAVAARPIFNRQGTFVVGNEIATGTVGDDGKHSTGVELEWRPLELPGQLRRHAHRQRRHAHRHASLDHARGPAAEPHLHLGGGAGEVVRARSLSTVITDPARQRRNSAISFRNIMRREIIRPHPEEGAEGVMAGLDPAIHVFALKFRLTLGFQQIVFETLSVVRCLGNR